jgi:hypothetical protein
VSRDWWDTQRPGTTVVCRVETPDGLDAVLETVAEEVSRRVVPPARARVAVVANPAGDGWVWARFGDGPDTRIGIDEAAGPDTTVTWSTRPIGEEDP